MRPLRLVLSVLTAAWGLVNLFPLLGTIAGKLGPIPVPPGWPVNLPVLLQQIPWWDVAVWTLMIVLYLRAAWALARGQRAFGVYVLAFVMELVRWLPVYTLPIYTQIWTSGELRFRYIAWGLLALMAAAIGWIERRWPQKPRLMTEAERG